MKNVSSLQFKIGQLRKERIAQATEGIAALIFAIFFSEYGPGLLVQYIFKSAARTPQFVREFLPVASIVFGLVYLLSVLIGNALRARKIGQLEAELERSMAFGDDCCGECGDCNCHDVMPSATRSMPEVKNASTSALAEKLKSTNQKKKKNKK